MIYAFISVGETEDAFVQQREQWTDGSNLLALAPGVVIGYERNVKTNARLARGRNQGIRDLWCRIGPRSRRRSLHELPD